MRIPYSQMILGLDQLIFNGKIESEQQAEERADTIEAYLAATGYTWDDIIGNLIDDIVSPKINN